MRRVRVVIAGDNRVLSDLRAMLSAESDFEVVASCRDGASCIEAIRDLSPNMALLDDSLPGQDGRQVLAAIKSERLRTRVVFLSAGGDQKKTIGWRSHGVVTMKGLLRPLLDYLRGFTSRPEGPPTPASPIRNKGGPHDVLKGPSTALTERERQIMQLVCEGQSNKEVGRKLKLTEGTVKVHLHHIYQKLAIRNRTALAVLAVHCGEEFSWAQYQAKREPASPPLFLNGGANALGATHLATSTIRRSRPRHTSQKGRKNLF
jgi:two-component system, NarL family, nitrate/nitrite response regulator NarL